MMNPRIEMMTDERDSDFVQWVLCCGPYAHPTYNFEIIEEHACEEIHHAEYFRNFDGADDNEVDNDEIIARTLQEDYFQLGISEKSENSRDQEHDLETTTNLYPRHNEPMENYSPELRCDAHDRTEFDESIEIGSCPSPSDFDEYELDSVVRERLNRMISVPHVPRINREIPSEDEAISDHERLLNRLQSYGFVEHRVEGDGNCQFRALSDQLYSTPDRHELVRRQIVNHLKSHSEMYEGHVPMEYPDYLKKMSWSGEWGDHVTLQAAAETYRVKILLITSFKGTCYIEILPESQTYKRVIFLSFWAEVHYNSIYFQRDLPPNEHNKKKKKWWHFGT